MFPIQAKSGLEWAPGIFIQKKHIDPENKGLRKIDPENKGVSRAILKTKELA
ncbi:MAG: hypothetical protein WBD10_00525 [Acidobacteriaceae bacterium]